MNFLPSDRLSGEPDLDMCPIDADRLSNNIGPDQTAPYLGMHCLLRSVCPNT